MEQLKPVYKNRFPFRLSATSFCFPASWGQNCRYLAPYVDEVELLFFSSRSADDLPTLQEIDELAEIGAMENLRFNIHLPIDIRPGTPDGEMRRHTVHTLKHLVQITTVLNPTTWTLHLPMENGTKHSQWIANLRHSMEELLEDGYSSRAFSIETLDYPLEWVGDIIHDLDLSVCIDIGHLIRYGYLSAQSLKLWQERTEIYHIHGAAGDRDHLPLGNLATEAAEILIPLLKQFTETVSIEVFNYSDFQASAETLIQMLAAPR